MENQNEKEKTPNVENEPSKLSAGESLWQKIQNMPYRKANIGKGFVMPYKIPKNAIKKDEKKDE